MNHSFKCLSLAAPLLLALLIGGGCQHAGRSECASTARANAANSPTASEPWYEPEVCAFEESDRKSPPEPGQVLFIGSSSFRLWKTLAADMAPMPILNRGFGGAKTPDVLAVFDRVVPACRPAIIVYYCGDNDLGIDNTDDQSVVRNFIAFDERVRALWPKTRVYFVAIKASVQRWNNWPAMKRANEAIRAYCERTPGRGFLDIVPPTLRADGTPDPALFEEDGLHINASGYTKWTSVVRPRLMEAWEQVKQER